MSESEYYMTGETLRLTYRNEARQYVPCSLSFRRCWIINQRGYANIIPSSGDRVHGFLYELSPKDEEFLDGYEGAPLTYGKKIMPIQPISPSGDGDSATKESIDALVYVDIVNTSCAAPKTEYIHRINMGLKDAFQMGFSQSYVERYIRPSIPSE